MPILIKASLILCFIAILIVISGYILKKIPSFSKFQSKVNNDITIQSITPVDVKRKIIKIKHLNAEYILLIGGNNDILIDKVSNNSAVNDIKMKIQKELDLQ